MFLNQKKSNTIQPYTIKLHVINKYIYTNMGLPSSNRLENTFNIKAYLYPDHICELKQSKSYRFIFFMVRIRKQ